MKKTLIAFTVLASILAAGNVAAKAHSPEPISPAQYMKYKQWTKHFDGMTIHMDKLGIVTVDGSPAARDEDSTDASVYSEGLHTFIWYKRTGKVAVQDRPSGKLLGYAK